MTNTFEFNFIGELPHLFEKGFQEISSNLNLIISEKATPIHVKNEGLGLTVKKENGNITITWNKPIHFYRALSHLVTNVHTDVFEIKEVPFFETGVMLDCSRNGVISISAFKSMLRKMALMGMDVGMLYTEDTYEVNGFPYFGYMRGRYNSSELRELDEYATLFGIELIPCIQTLGHLGRALRWPTMQKYCDVPEVLLADYEDTYTLIEQMITSISSSFRSNRIHIGMDEAHGVGLGTHLKKYGYEDPHNIIKRHLVRVKEITDKLNLSPIMWSDMFFRLDSADNEYYDTDPSEKAKEAIVSDVELMYWDYSHEEESDYLSMIDKHRTLMGSLDNTSFAGAIWAWTGPVPEYEKTIRSSVPALEACKNAGIKFALATVWGDNGQESSRICALPGMQLYAEYAYTGTYNLDNLKTRFSACCGGDLDQFLGLSEFNTLPNMDICPDRPLNMAKFLLYQDPLVQLCVKDMEGYDLTSHYSTLATKYKAYATIDNEYKLQMEFYYTLAELLSVKCNWHQNIIDLVKSNKKEEAYKLCLTTLPLVDKIEELRLLWSEIWRNDNKPFGFEILDGRMGSLQVRIKTACSRVTNWANGDLTETLDELYEEVLPFGLGYIRPDMQCGLYGFGEIVSANKIDY